MGIIVNDGDSKPVNVTNFGLPMEKEKSVKSGDMVSWNSSGGKAQGKVVRVVSNGKINVPDSSFNIPGTEDDPAVLIQLYRDGKPTETKVGHKMSTLRKSELVEKHQDHDQSSHGSWSDNPHNADNPKHMDSMDMGRPQSSYKPTAAQRKLINRVTSPASSTYLSNRPFGGVQFHNTWIKNGKHVTGYTPDTSGNPS